MTFYSTIVMCIVEFASIGVLVVQYTHVVTKFIRSMSHSVAEPDLTKCDMFLGQHLC